MKMTNKMKFIPHDTDIGNDVKIKSLKGKYKGLGYGTYWIILETLTHENENKLKLKPLTYLAIASETGMEAEKVKEFIDDCINSFELFESDEEYFWSNSLLRRIKKYNDICEKNAENVKKRWDKNKEKNGIDSNTNGIESECEPNTNRIPTVYQSNTDSYEGDTNKSKVNINNNINSTFSTNSTVRPKDREKEYIPSTPDSANREPPPKPKKPKVLDDYPEEARNFAKWFRGLLPEELALKKTEKDFISWADTYDKLIRVDNISKREIFEVTQWARANDFWSSNFLSACKLRRKDKTGTQFFDVFKEYMKSEQKNKQETVYRNSYAHPDDFATNQFII
jgi:hypothetical protein